MAELAKELIAAKLKAENAITKIVNDFQAESGVAVNWCNFARRDEGAWPQPVVFTTLEVSLNKPDHVVG